jgi:two-component system cell cycle response regulator DivK
MPKKVLIVEDSTDIREALAMLIEYEGYEAIVASNGREGYLLAQVHVPDLILMDLAMPGYTGIDATRHIRTDPKTFAVPIVCVTSYSDTFEAEAIAAGADEVHTKSSFMDHFRVILKKYLES